MSTNVSATLAAVENIVAPPDLECELIEIRHVIGLAAFAAEARRVLTAVDSVADAIPNVGAALHELIPDSRQWSEYPDMLAPVLDDLHDRLGLLIGRAEP